MTDDSTAEETADDSPTEADSDVAERYLQEARYSRSTLVQADGSRHVREKDHETGEVEEYTLPPESN